MTHSDRDGRTCSVDGCERRHEAHGYCRMHLRRVQRHGSPGEAGRRRIERLPNCSAEGCEAKIIRQGRSGMCLKHYEERRFWERVQVTGSCWFWLGSLDPVGRYGRLTVEGKSIRAHRYMYQLLVGPIPDGLVLDHLCRTRACVNPDHLDPVTPGENTLRANAHSIHDTRKRQAA